MTPAEVSIVIPALNERANIKAAIESARDAGAEQIIVVDGGSQDETTEAAAAAGATTIVESAAGRGVQLNRGAAVATGSFLLFLHADNRLGSQCLSQICDHPNVVWGAFRQRVDSDLKRFRVIELGNALRVRLRGMAFGDQGIFVDRAVFEKHGGYQEIPLMEDVALSRMLRKVRTPVLLDGPLTISPRRWLQNGLVRQTVTNWRLQLAFHFGASPESLAQRYR